MNFTTELEQIIPEEHDFNVCELGNISFMPCEHTGCSGRVCKERPVECTCGGEQEKKTKIAQILSLIREGIGEDESMDAAIKTKSHAGAGYTIGRNALRKHLRTRFGLKEENER